MGMDSAALTADFIRLENPAGLPQGLDSSFGPDHTAHRPDYYYSFLIYGSGTDPELQNKLRNPDFLY